MSQTREIIAASLVVSCSCIFGHHAEVYLESLDCNYSILSLFMLQQFVSDTFQKTIVCEPKMGFSLLWLCGKSACILLNSCSSNMITHVTANETVNITEGQVVCPYVLWRENLETTDSTEANVSTNIERNHKLSQFLSIRVTLMCHLNSLNVSDITHL